LDQSFCNKSPCKLISKYYIRVATTAMSIHGLS
jgi:hypothetical protein